MKHNLSTRWMSYGLILLTGATALVGCPGDDGGPSGAITISINPTSATIPQGGSAPVTATVTRTGGFTGAVTITVQGAPTGVTGTVSNVVTTGNVTTATVTIAVAAATPAGVYNLSVRGQGTGVTDATTAFTLTVTVADFGLSLSSPALTIEQGGNAPTTVTIARTNFTGAVTLSLGGAPAGVTGVFDPAAPTGTSSVLTVTVGATVAPGVYNLTVDGTGTPGNRSTPLTLTVTAAGANFSLSLSEAALTIAQGGNAPTTVTITRTNFTDALTMSLSDPPSGITGVFDPAAPTGTSSVLTVTVGAAVAPGVYNLSVDGTGLPGNRSTPLTLTVVAAADFSLSLSAAALTIAQGGNAPTTVTITRTNFTDAVTLSLGGAPAGVTGVFDPAAPTGTSSVLTVTVGAAVAPGVYNLTVDGTGTPGNRSTPLTLTVTAAANFSLSLSAAALTIAQGGSAPTTVTITRTNFTDAVTLSLGGAPAGITGVFVPPAPTGTSSVLTVTVGGAVAPGVYNLTVDGTGTPGTRSTALTVTVTAPGGGNVTVSFAGCEAENKAVWLAFQDGNGPWTVVTGVADIYSFDITSGKGGVAWVSTATGTSSVFVQYMTQAELTAGTATFCIPPGGNTVTGTAAGVGATQTAQISLGGATTLATFATLPFTLNGVESGTHDLVGYRRDIAIGATDRGLLRRDLNIPATTSVGTVDMEGAESFGAAAATMTLAGLVGGETLSHGMLYQVGATCEAAPLYFAASAAASFTAYGIPAAPQRASDFHGIFISAITGTTQFRTLFEYFHTLAARTLTLGAQMPVPVITDLGGPYKRLQAVYMLPADYQSSTVFQYDDGGGKSVTIFATFAYLGGAAVTLALPDFSALSGWDNNWPPASASTGTWSVTGSGTENLTGSVCTENARIRSGTVAGTY